MAPKIILHQWEISPFCRKVRKILAAKKLSYTKADYNGLLALKGRRVGPSGKLPVLEYNNQKLEDSTQIFKFLEERHPDPALLPEDPHERRLVFFLEDWADEALFWYEVYFRFEDSAALDKTADVFCQGRPSFEKIPFKLIAGREARKKLKLQGLSCYHREEVLDKFRSYLKNLQEQLDGRDWLVGNNMSIADIAVSSQLDEMVRTSDVAIQEISRFPTLKAWLDQHSAD